MQICSLPVLTFSGFLEEIKHCEFTIWLMLHKTEHFHADTSPYCHMHQIIGDATASHDMKINDEDVGIWAPISYFDGAYYATISGAAEFYLADSAGKYLIFITGSYNGTAYGFVPAFNSKLLFILLIRTSAQHIQTCRDQQVHSDKIEHCFGTDELSSIRVLPLKGRSSILLSYLIYIVRIHGASCFLF